MLDKYAFIFIKYFLKRCPDCTKDHNLTAVDVILLA